MKVNDKFDTDRDNSFDDQIDLEIIFSFLFKWKKMIFLFTLIGLIIGAVYSSVIKRVWAGQFKIVLAEQNANFVQNPKIQNLPFLERNSSPLQTELEILKSPSVLMDIFEFVKANRIADGKGSKELRFNDWKKSLDINLIKGTNVLDLIYEDNDKEKIIPVLKKISNKYQEYSGSKRLRRIELGMRFYDEQLKIFRDQTKNSLRKAQEYAIEQDLSILGDAGIDQDISATINIVKIRVAAANQIRNIDKQLEQLNSLEKNSNTNQILHKASVIESFPNDGLLKLQEIDEKLAFLRVTYTEKDKNIKKLLLERDLLLELLKKQVKGFLIAKKDDALARLKASERPKGVLLKYTELVNDYNRDAKTLSELETQFRKLSLEKARLEDPWELITKPTLLPNPVYPNKKRITLLTGLLGGFAGMVTSLLISKKENIIYDIKSIQTKTNLKIIETVENENDELMRESISLIKNFLNNKVKANTIIYSPSQITNLKNRKYIDEIISIAPNNIKLFLTTEFLETFNFENIIILITLGNSKLNDIEKIERRLLSLEKNILGTIVLKDFMDK